MKLSQAVLTALAVSDPQSLSSLFASRDPRSLMKMHTNPLSLARKNMRRLEEESVTTSACFYDNIHLLIDFGTYCDGLTAIAACEADGNTIKTNPDFIGLKDCACNCEGCEAIFGGEEADEVEEADEGGSHEYTAGDSCDWSSMEKTDAVPFVENSDCAIKFQATSDICVGGLVAPFPSCGAICEPGCTDALIGLLAECEGEPTSFYKDDEGS